MTTGPVEAPVETITELLSVENKDAEDQVRQEK
jgi:hypothetical protein